MERKKEISRKKWKERKKERKKYQERNAKKERKKCKESTAINDYLSGAKNFLKVSFENFNFVKDACFATRMPL